MMLTKNDITSTTSSGFVIVGSPLPQIEV